MGGCVVFVGMDYGVPDAVVVSTEMPTVVVLDTEVPADVIMASGVPDAGAPAAVGLHIVVEVVVR